jgi:hypothetical protein
MVRMLVNMTVSSAIEQKGGREATEEWECLYVQRCVVNGNWARWRHVDCKILQ